MQKYPSPKTPGPMPQDLGLRPGGNLKACIDGRPHCFSSSREILDGGTGEDNDLFDADSRAALGEEDWLVKPLEHKLPVAEALADVVDAVQKYPPGQSGIDGGGFQIVAQKATPESAYLYVQFESLRKGYIDDVEFAVSPSKVNVRTSSRLGYLDAGVNAKRFNWFARELGKKPGWHTTPITAKASPQYFAQNGITDGDVIGAAPPAAPAQPGKSKSR